MADLPRPRSIPSSTFKSGTRHGRPAKDRRLANVEPKSQEAHTEPYRTGNRNIVTVQNRPETATVDSHIPSHSNKTTLAPHNCVTLDSKLHRLLGLDRTYHAHQFLFSFTF